MSIKYKLVVEDNPIQLEDRVNELIKEGWDLYGDLAVAAVAIPIAHRAPDEMCIDFTFAQPMIQYPEMVYADVQSGIRDELKVPIA